MIGVIIFSLLIRAFVANYEASNARTYPLNRFIIMNNKNNIR